MRCPQRVWVAVLLLTNASSFKLWTTSRQQNCPSRQTMTRSFGWSCAIEVDSSRKIQSRPLDSENSSPRQWLEYHESRNDNVGGVYTVMRCDLCHDGSWKRWGQDFHLQRLVQSHAMHCDQVLSSKEEAVARDSSTKVIHSLLSKGTQNLQGQSASEVGEICVAMVTLLWQTEGDNHNKLVVRGHIYSSGAYANAQRDYQPDSIVLSLARPRGDDTLPNRWSHLPEAKLSSWCRRRRPLEEQFKKHGASEVLLTMMDSTGQHILEGLTTNVFVRYHNGTMRTPSSGVLGGFARSLVVRSAKALGIVIEEGPLAFEPEKWAEVFVTSSIRLLVPVVSIIEIEGDDANVLWRAPPEDSCKWRTIYEDVLAREYQ